MVGSNKKKGFFLVEVIVGVMILIPCTLLILEIIRRELFDLSLQHIACKSVRQLALGQSSLSIEKQTRESLTDRFGKKLGQTVWESMREKKYFAYDVESLNWLRLGKRPGSVVELYLRYPQFLQFKTNRTAKHHQELIRRCLYPVS